MPEYIERDAAVMQAEKYGLGYGSVLGHHSGIADCIASEIAALPAADVAPVVYGHWLSWGAKFPERTVARESHLGVFCSVCGNHADNPSNFCPTCGAYVTDENNI